MRGRVDLLCGTIWGTLSLIKPIYSVNYSLLALDRDVRHHECHNYPWDTSVSRKESPELRTGELGPKCVWAQESKWESECSCRQAQAHL